MNNKINNSFNYFLGKHKHLNYILKSIRRLLDEDYIDTSLGRNPENVTFEHPGTNYADKIIYFIEIGDEGDGFFAEYRKMLNLLYYADCHALTPYVVFNEKFHYGKFEDYFEHVPKLEYSKVIKSANMIHSGICHVLPAELLKEVSAYATSKQYIEAMARISAKYVKFNTELQDQIEKDIKELQFSGKVLGVHVRGSDFKNNFKNHPTYVPVHDFCSKAEEIAQNGNYDKVFLATDDTEAVGIFKKCFGEKLIFYKDTSRTSGNVSVAFQNAMIEDEEKSRLGKEVIRDMFTLARCSGLIAGKSQVSICARISNQAWFNEYKDIIILDKGINTDGKRYIY